MSKLKKRKGWRPRFADGSVFKGGAGGFHKPQTDRKSALDRQDGQTINAVVVDEAFDGVKPKDEPLLPLEVACPVCGAPALMGCTRAPWTDTKAVLKHVHEAREAEAAEKTR